MVSTSADELEEAFMRRKRRELEQARMAGAGDAQPVQQVVRSTGKSRPQRSLPLRLRQEIQEVPRRLASGVIDWLFAPSDRQRRESSWSRRRPRRHAEDPWE